MDRATFGVKDASLIKTKACPETGSIYTAGIDLGALSSRGARLADCEMLIEAPVCAAGNLVDDETLKYTIESDDDSAFGSVTTLAADVITQTGATGAAAATYRFKIPSDCERYIRVKVTASDADGDSTGVSVTVSILS